MMTAGRTPNAGSGPDPTRRADPRPDWAGGEANGEGNWSLRSKTEQPAISNHLQKCWRRRVGSRAGSRAQKRTVRIEGQGRMAEAKKKTKVVGEAVTGKIGEAKFSDRLDNLLDGAEKAEQKERSEKILETMALFLFFFFSFLMRTCSERYHQPQPTLRFVISLAKFDAPREAVWGHDSRPELLRRWMFGGRPALSSSPAGE